MNIILLLFLSTHEVPRRFANLGERRTLAKLCERPRFGWVVLRIVVWRKDRPRWPVNRRRDSIAPKKSVYGAKLTRRGGVSWPGDKAARCPWRSYHRVLPIILYPRLVPVAYIFYFLSAPLVLASNVRIVKILQTFLSSSQERWIKADLFEICSFQVYVIRGDIMGQLFFRFYKSYVIKLWIFFYSFLSIYD